MYKPPRTKPPPRPQGLPANHRRLVRRRAAAGLGLFLLLLAFAATFARDGDRRDLDGSRFNTGRNGIWLAHTWVGDQHSPQEVVQFAHALANDGFRYLYVHVGPLETDGTVPVERYAYAGTFVHAVRMAEPNLRLLAWVGGINQAGAVGPGLDLTRTDTRSNIATSVRTIIGSGPWDGVHLNIEPLPSGREDYLDLLDQIRSTLAPSQTLSVAGLKLWIFPLPLTLFPRLRDWLWDADYTRAVARRVDQVAVMTYDSGIPLRRPFVLYQAAETEALLDALSTLPDVELLVGVPTYSDQRWNFHEQAENMSSGLEGITRGLRQTSHSRPFVGVAVYAEWTTSVDEWATYRHQWLGHNR